MKLNEETSKTNVCKEEALLCIFKDVPNFLQEEGEISTVGGSHQDVLVGRQGTSPCLSKAPRDPKRTYLLQLNSNEVESKDNLTMKLLTRKKEKKLKEQCPSEELQCWSSVSEESQLSDDSFAGVIKKRRKKTKRNYRSFGNPHLNLSIEYMRTPESDMYFDERYTSADDLCSECLWLVRAAKECTVSSSSEDFQSRNGTQDDSVEHLSDLKSYTENDVLRILSDVHLKLVECSIILTTYKLTKKVKKKATDENLDKESPETLSDEKLLDEIQDEEESKNGTSKLCLVLGKLVSKYLKTR